MLREMVATPRITKDYWAEANALELAYINEHVSPQVPEALDHPRTAWTAIGLRRHALPNNAIAVWWSATYDADGPGFWTDIDGRAVDLLGEA